MSEDRQNIQDRFLNSARKTDLPVSIYVTNGYLIDHARIVGFDSYAVLVESDGKQMLVYKHAISTITPESKLEL